MKWVLTGGFPLVTYKLSIRRNDEETSNSRTSYYTPMHNTYIVLHHSALCVKIEDTT